MIHKLFNQIFILTNAVYKTAWNSVVSWFFVGSQRKSGGNTAMTPNGSDDKIIQSNVSNNLAVNYHLRKSV